jgi:tetratricopeptide (TPR) repeat protein
LDHIIFKWGKHIALQCNSKKVLEGYFQQILLWVINKALYFKRGGSSANAIGVLEGTMNLYESMKSSKYPETINICGRFALVLGLLYLEVQLVNNALDLLIGGMKCWSVEQKMRLKEYNQLAEYKFSLRVAYKLRRALLFISVGMYNIGLAYETLSQYNEALESYRMCKWYCKTERDIFFSNPILNAQRFMAESSTEQEGRILTNLEIKTETQRAVESIKTTHKLEALDIQEVINSIWSQPIEARELNERIKSNNFRVILDTIKGRQSDLSKTPSSFIERNTTDFGSSRTMTRTVVPSTPAGSRYSIKTEPRADRVSLKKDQKMLDPDNFFKRKICSDLQIDSDWLDETDPRKRFRQDMIESIIKRENNSHKSIKILKNFLLTKGKDNIAQEPEEKNPRAIQKTAYYEVGHKIHVLQADLATQGSNETAKKPLHSIEGRTLTLSSPARILGSDKFKDPIQKEQEQKKIMIKLAEKLHRDINYLENTLYHSKGKHAPKSHMSKKKEDSLDPQEVIKYQNLANSVAYRMTRVPQKKVKQRGNAMRSKFAK